MSAIEGRRLDWLIAAKLSPPHMLVPQIVRQAALATLTQAAQSRLALLVSPAGFGKTTLLAQWHGMVSSGGGMVGWVSLDEDDTDPLQFLGAITLSLTTAGAPMGELEKIAWQGFTDVPLDAALAAILHAVARLPQPVYLVLDDYHRVQSAAVDRLLEKMLCGGPDSLHVVLSSRERPALNLSTLKAQGVAHEVGANVLRFSVDEARSLFAGMLDVPAVSRLVERTEGWGVALQLARLWLDSTASPAEITESFPAPIADVADYLTEQVFNDLPEESRTVLLQTSVCERITGALANAITGRSDCWEILARLERLHVLLIPLDGERRWFRCHLLFREYLLDLLRRRYGDRIAELHLAASAWFDAEGMTVEATRHARLAGDFARVTQLIAGAGGWELVVFGGIGMLRSLLRNLPAEVLRRHATLGIARSYLHVKDGEMVEARAVFEAIDPDAPLCPGEDPGRIARDRQLIGGLIDIYEDRVVSRDDFERLQAGAVHLDPGDHLGLGAHCQSVAVVALRLGRGAVVEQAAVDAVRHMRAANSVLGLNYGRFHLGQAQMIACRLPEAQATLREALSTAEENFGADSGQKAIADVLLAAVLYQLDELEAAQAHLARSLSHVEENDSWFDVLACGYETAALLACHRRGADSALALLGHAEQVARRRGLPGLQPLIQALRVRVLVRAGELLAAAAAARRQEFLFTRSQWRTQPHVWRTHHQSGLALAGLYIAQGAVGHALDVLGDLRELAEQDARGLHLVQLEVLQALALRIGGRHDQAVTALMQALATAMPAGASRVFLDEGAAMVALLTQALRQQRLHSADSLTRVQLTELLNMLRSEHAGGGRSGAEDFSIRELEVLHELGHGYSNKEIGRALNMTENTVKFHLKNIFAKLGVDKRGAAVAKAREQGMIP